MDKKELLQMLREKLIANEEKDVSDLSSWEYGVFCGKAAMLEDLIVEISGNSIGI